MLNGIWMGTEAPWRMRIRQLAGHAVRERHLQRISQSLVVHLRTCRDLQVENSTGYGIAWNRDVRKAEMGVNAKIAVFALTAGILLRPCLASDVALESTTWPAPIPCNTCITLQFGVLEMKLSPTQIQRIFISDTEPFALHLLPTGAVDGRTGALFMSATRAAYIGKYEALGMAGANSMNGQEFFDLLGNPGRRSDALTKVRRIENFDNADRYTKSSRGKIHAYWVQAAPPKSQYIHFVIDDNDTIYSLVGAIAPELYNAILANLRVRPTP